MASDAIYGDHTASGSQQQHPRKLEEKRHRSIFEVPSDFFDSCRILWFPSSFSIVEPLHSLSISTVHTREPVGDDEEVEANSQQPQETTKNKTLRRWSCNTCKSEFESLEDQRFHFKSDIHRFNIKLSLAGKDTMKEEDFEKLCSDSFCKDYDISSISGSEDEEDRDSVVCNRGFGGATKKKIYVQLQSGERVSVWKCILLDESENISLEDDNAFASNSDVYMSCLTERESIEKLKYLIHLPRDNISLRVILLARGGHFAGCVFDGNSIVAHKTFHRYVVRAKAGKKQSSKDASGRSAHSAGASLRRYNELALKKDILELLAAWKSYFDASSCIFIYAPSNNRQLFFDGEKPYFSCHRHAIRNIPLTVRRPTFKEARRIYYLLTQISYEVDEKIEPNIDGDSQSSARVLTDVCPGASKDTHVNSLGHEETTEASVGIKEFDKLSKSSGSEREFTVKTTPLHDAARGGNAQKVLELLEHGMDPCIKDQRGRTPYMLASEKEVRNTFRRFLASNLDKWDWHAANVPSALTKEMEESQAAKQAEKDAKRKARSKELKKLRKAKDKKPQAESTQSQTTSMVSGSRGSTAIPSLKVLSPCSGGVRMSKEEALKRAQEEEREKRAAAAERRIAALKAQGSSLITTSNSSQPKNVVATDLSCSCCNASLAGVVPFHRYNFKYCSTSCMHVHREILEDG